MCSTVWFKEVDWFCEPYFPRKVIPGHLFDLSFNFGTARVALPEDLRPLEPFVNSYEQFSIS